MSRRFILYLVIVISLFTVAIVSAQEATPDSATPKTIEYLVTADSANLRTGAGTTFPSAGKVLKGDSLLIYEETPETSGWLRVYQSGHADAFIADFLVERAPVRFYPADQEPVFEVSGKGKDTTDVYDIPRGAYRIDASVEDRSFILKMINVEGNCKDDTVFNELNLDARSLSFSGLFVSSGCSVIFETDNVDGKWSFALRDVIGDEDFLTKTTLVLEDGSSIPGTGRALTMPTFLSEGIWTISANVNDNAYILRPQVLSGDCDGSATFNEFDSSSKTLELSTIYKSPKDGCIIFWETSNVDGSWEIAFDKVR